ncbi:MAG: hypothetical protein WC523_00595 [Patescibacteria group bacterium]
MTLFPNQIDSDLELPLADDNVTEITADSINSIRDAVLAIEDTLGINLQGNEDSLADRINVSIDENGAIKSAALDGIGLVGLPVLDRHVGANAGIKESKLSLDYDTVTLKTWIDSSKTDILGLQTGYTSLSNTLNEHTLGVSNFHDGYQIKIDVNNIGVIGGLSPSTATIGDAINEIASYLFGGDNTITPHIESGLDFPFRHEASNIEVDTSSFTSIIDKTSTDVQSALEDIDSSAGALGITHTIDFHSNGVFKTIASGDLFNEKQKVLSSSAITYAEDTGIVTFTALSNFSNYNIEVGDIIYIQGNADDAGTYQIRAIGPLSDSESLGNFPILLSNQLAIFHTFSETVVAGDNIIAEIYKPIFISNESCPLACAIRNNETIVDSVSVLNPQTARVKSIGFNAPILALDGYEVCVTVGIGAGNYRSVTIPDLSLDRLSLSAASPVNAKSVADRINAYVSDPVGQLHFPITAYRIGDELAIAHNWVGDGYTITIEDGYNGNYALGLDAYGADVVGKVIYGNEGLNYSVSGKSLGGLTITLEAYIDITSDSSTFTLYSASGQIINPLDYNIVSGSVMHVMGHPTGTVNGSYTVMTSTTSTVSVFASEEIPVVTNPTRFYVRFTSADLSLNLLNNSETDKGLVEIYVDSNQNALLHQRLIYGSTLGSSIEIIGLSSGFPNGEFNVFVDTGVADTVNFYLINSSLTGSVSSISNTFVGSFKLYHPNNIDYLLLNILPGTILGGIEDLSVFPYIPEDEALLLGTVHFDGELKATNIFDNRLFGNLGMLDVRDDVVSAMTQRPISELRADGVIRGFDIITSEQFSDSMTNMVAVPLTGGVAYIDGVRIAIETQRVVIPSSDSGQLITGNKIIGVNGLGTLQTFDDDLGTLLVDGYDSIYGRVLPLYYVYLTDGGINNTTTDITDIRKFINNIDNKIELVVDGSANNLSGNFKTLEGALAYAEKYPNDEKIIIKIINDIIPAKPIVVPNGVSILGAGPYGAGKQKISNASIQGSHFITLEGNNRLENIEINSDIASLDSSLVYITGSNVTIEKCYFKFGESVTTYENDIAIEISTLATENIKIVNNYIDTVYSGIVSNAGVENLLIEDNNITNVSGTGGLSYAIKVSSADRTVKNISILKNNIDIPSIVSATDLRAVMVEIENNISTLRICDNNIVHAAQNTITNGIRIDLLDNSVTGIVDQLFINDNLIDGIKLDDNEIYGIYVANTYHVHIHRNTIMNMGTGNNNDIAIRILDGLKFADISYNTIKDCDLYRGILIDAQTDTTSRVKISNNSLINLGIMASSAYIYGAVLYSSITDNILVGPGVTGIRWNGSNSKISGNNISQPGDLSVTDYAFSTQAIYAYASDLDISNNIITGMVSSGCIGITNVSSGSGRVKISGNTISGSEISKAISLYGSDHIVVSNRIYNSINFVTECISLDGVTESIVTSNFFGGSFTYSVSGDYDVNILGINKGFQDTLSVPASAAQTSFDEDGLPQWKLTSTAGQWDENLNSSVGTYVRTLYFPIDNIPNGAKLNYAKVQGYIDVGAGASAFTAQLYKQDVLTTMGTTAISDMLDMSGAGAIFGNSGSVGLVTVTTAGGEIIDYSKYNYFLKIRANSVINYSATVYGATVVFTY